MSFTSAACSAAETASAGSAAIAATGKKRETTSTRRTPYRMAILEPDASSRCNYHRLLAIETPLAASGFARSAASGYKLLAGARDADRERPTGIGPLHHEVQGHVGEHDRLLMIGGRRVFRRGERQVTLRGAASEQRFGVFVVERHAGRQR